MLRAGPACKCRICRMGRFGRAVCLLHTLCISESVRAAGRRAGKRFARLACQKRPAREGPKSGAFDTSGPFDTRRTGHFDSGVKRGGGLHVLGEMSSLPFKDLQDESDASVPTDSEARRLLRAGQRILCRGDYRVCQARPLIARPVLSAARKRNSALLLTRDAALGRLCDQEGVRSAGWR